MAASTALSGALRGSRDELVTRWLDRISARVAIAPNLVFPTEELLNHVPLLIDGIAAFVDVGATDIDAETPVIAKARELGALRHAQGFDVYQILKEYELMSSVLTAFITERVEAGEIDCSAGDLLRVADRVSQAVELIRQATTTHFLRLAAETVSDREEKLRRFNRMVSHELKNHVSAIKGAVSLMGEEWIDDATRARFLKMASENVVGLQHVLENLEMLSRSGVDSRQNRNVLLPSAAREAARQLREMADARGVAVEVSEDLPAVEVNAPAVELCLTNYISNAIKYCDQSRPDRHVRITGQFHPREASGRGGELVVRVEDNGIGVPKEQRAKLFSQFYRAPNNTITGAEGTGLGLSIVRETVESFGGSAWVEFPEKGGSVFAFSLPSRRDEDAAAAGVTRIPT
jgi:signal transduction histidine kinase